MPKRNLHDEAIAEMVAERRQWREEARRANPITAGTERLADAATARARMEAMTPQERLAAYQADPEGTLRLYRDKGD